MESKELPKTYYYKVFEDEHLTCKGFKFEFHKVYKIEGELKICKNGFHACKNLIDCFGYKRFHLSMRVCIVQLLGNTITEGNKTAGEKIKLIRELPFWEIDRLVNKGHFNLGYGNKGNNNTGNCNKGNSNTGNYNEGIHNKGDRNKGDFNKGSDNKGDHNEGDHNKGYGNQGNGNQGNGNNG